MKTVNEEEISNNEKHLLTDYDLSLLIKYIIRWVHT